MDNILMKYARMKRYIKNQWLYRDQLIDMQNSKLRKIVHHAYNNVPYYKELFDSVNMAPSDIKYVEDLKEFPITYKEQICHLPTSNLIAKGTDLNKCIHGKTSGSTGLPLKVILSPRDLSIHNAYWHSLLNACGYKITDKLLSITSRFPKVYKTRWYEYLGIGRTEFLFITEEPDYLLQKVESINPDIILSYPTSLLVLAESLSRKGGIGRGPKIIISTSESLDKASRKYITKAFNTEIIDYYGSWETGVIAWECQKHEGYHINIDSVVVEVIKDNKNVSPGEIGEIVVTNLNSYTMPFIRYNLKDVGVYTDETCSCGRGLPLLERVEGRSDEIVVFPSGELLPPIVFYAIKYIDGVVKFQVIQERLDSLDILLVLEDNCGEEVVLNVEEKLRETIKNKIQLRIQVVDDISKYPSGKQQCVISKVKKNFN